MLLEMTSSVNITKIQKKCLGLNTNANSDLKRVLTEFSLRLRKREREASLHRPSSAPTIAAPTKCLKDAVLFSFSSMSY